MTKLIVEAAGRAPATAAFSDGYKTKVLALLLMGYTLNFMDRLIFSAIGIPIREDLHLTSTQLGVLNGLYFALTYVILGVPVARIADRISRVGVIGLALIVWSAFTALCGTAANFASLALYRFGVGFGEAGFSAPAHSLISDLYEPRKRASALSVFSLGVPIGGLFGAVLGGYLAEWFGWRAAFCVVGVPGVAVGILTWLFVKEPRRGGTDAPADTPAPEAAVKPKAGIWTELKELGGVARTLFLQWPMFNVVVGMTLVSFSGYGVYSFVAQYVYARFSLSLGLTNLLIGLMIIGSAVGTLAGGFLADNMAKRAPAWHALVPAIGLIICLPLYAFAYTRSSYQVMFLILAIPAALHYLYMAPSFALAQNAVPAHRRATMSALLLFVVNFIGLGGGPTFAGALVDYYANLTYVDPTIHSFLPALGDALSYAFGQMVEAYVDFFTFTSHPAVGAEVFRNACPGGTAPDGAGAVAAAACNRALWWGSQQSILIGLGAYGWGAVHYLLASFGLAKLLKLRDIAATGPAAAR